MTTDTIGVAFTHAVELIAGLREHDVQVALVTFGTAATAEQHHRIEDCGAIEWYESELALEWMSDPWDDQRAAQEWLLELARAESSDVVHLGGYGHAAAGWHAPVVITAHSCVCSWWRGVHGISPPSAWQSYRRWVRDGLQHADAVIAPTDAMLRGLRADYGDWPGRALVIHNATRILAAPAETDKQPFVLAAGRFWDAAKNLEVLAAAARRLAPGSVCVVGNTGNNAVPRSLTALGPLTADRLSAQRRIAAVYAAPARYEPFGLAILEAARDRCALVLGDISSLRELWDGAAVFVAPGDADQLADRLQWLLGDPAAAAELGERALRRSWRFDARGHAGRHVALYRQLTGASGMSGISRRERRACEMSTSAMVSDGSS